MGKHRRLFALGAVLSNCVPALIEFWLRPRTAEYGGESAQSGEVKEAGGGSWEGRVVCVIRRRGTTQLQNVGSQRYYKYKGGNNRHQEHSFCVPPLAVGGAPGRSRP